MADYKLKVLECGAKYKLGESEPIEAFGSLLPEYFRTFFLLNGRKEGQNWIVEMRIQIMKAGTPQATEITCKGFTKAKTLQNISAITDFEPVQAWQLLAVNSLLKEFLFLSVELALSSLTFSGTLENPIEPLAKLRIYPDGRTILVMETTKEFSEIELREIRKSVERVIDRRGISPEDHLETAWLVEEEVLRAKNTGEKSRHNIVVSNHFGITDKGAQYRIAQAKEKKYLGKDNKVSAKWRTTKKGKSNGTK
jgi:hypothetical protein